MEVDKLESMLLLRRAVVLLMKLVLVEVLLIA